VVTAISNNDRTYLVTLLAQGADPDAPHRDTCPLVFAAHRGEIEIIDLLLQYKADINQQDAKGMTALMVAAAGQQHDLCRALLARRADINAQDKDGRTALMHAALQADHEAIALLVSAGADALVKNKAGKTVLDDLAVPANAGLRATFNAAQKEAAKINTAMTAHVTVRKPLQIRLK
jgi:ankyrin repeat protein